MDELNREMYTMSDGDESFIVLGSSPTPSMERYVSGDEQRQESMTNNRCAQAFSNNFSLVGADDPLKSSIMMTPPQSIQSVQSTSTTASINGSNSQSGSVIMGDIKTSSLQNFPSEMRSSLPIVESQLAQHLTNGHELLKEYIEMTNVALRESLTSLQKWHEENNAKHKYNQVEMNDEQTAIIDQLKEENYKLKQFFRTAETRATEQEKRATEQEKRAVNLEVTLERVVDETKNQIQAERVSALAEMEKLKKNVSEKESILKNIIDQLKEKNYKLEKLVHTAENQAKEQEKRAIEQEKRAFEQEERADNLEITLERAVDETKNQIQAERVSALAEMDELKKNVSEKESILKNTIDQHKEENHRLEQLVHTAETRAKEQEKRTVELEKCLTEQEKHIVEQEMRTTEQEKRAANLEITLERELDEAKKQIQVERVSALAELDELKKNMTEKESILKNIIDQHKEEILKLQQLVCTAETRATEQEKCATEQENRVAILEVKLERALDVAKNQIEAERDSALAKFDELRGLLYEKNSIIDQFKEENHRLEQLVRTAETQATEQEKRATEQEKRATEQEKRAANLESALVDAVNQNLEERGSALAELDELKKDASDKESIRKNMAQRIERLELEKQELVIAKQKQLDTGKIGVNFITIEEHNRQIEVLRREIATIVAKNLEFEEMVPTTIIPARVMENLDVLLHDAGRASLKQIRLLYDRPLINLGKHNPSLSQLEAQKLALVKGVRQKLNQMQRYLIVCRIADKLRLVHENIGDRQYLMQAVNIYSISDLLRLENGELSDFLLNVLVEFEQHIRKCEICSAKAYNCEDCQNGELLFPFDEDAIICTSCYSMSHRSCLARQNQFCQKCRRLLIRRKLGERS